MTHKGNVVFILMQKNFSFRFFLQKTIEIMMSDKIELKELKGYRTKQKFK